jgi:rhomboid-like protein
MSTFVRAISRHVLFAGTFCTATTVASVTYTQYNKRGTRSDGTRVIVPLIAANAAVFGLFWFPPAQRMLAKHFMHDIRSGPWSMLLSTFAHMEPVHLLFNMVGLYTFGHTLHAALGDAQFLAFYANAGVLSSLVSHAAKVRAVNFAPSIGASGAIYGLMAATTFLNPFSRFTFILVPFFSFPAYALLPAILAVDCAGVLLRWRRFDHVAHLGGAVAGGGMIAGLCSVYGFSPPWLRDLLKKNQAPPPRGN